MQETLVILALSLSFVAPAASAQPSSRCKVPTTEGAANEVAEEAASICGNEGKRLYEAGNYAEAVTPFLIGSRWGVDAETFLLYAARCYDKLGYARSSVELYQVVIASDCTDNYCQLAKNYADDESKPLLAEVNQASRTAASAKEAAKAGNHTLAIKRYKQAEEVLHSPEHSLGIAQSSRQLGRLLEAQNVYRQLLTQPLPDYAPKDFHNAYKEAERLSDALDSVIPRINVVLNVPSGHTAAVTLNGERLPDASVGIDVPVDPGEYLLEAQSTSLQCTTAQTRVREHQGVVALSLRCTNPTEPPPPSDPSIHPAWGWAAVGAGALSLGVGTFLLFEQARVANERGEKISECGEVCEGPLSTLSEEGRRQNNDIDNDATKVTLLGGFGGTSMALGGALGTLGVLLLTTDVFQPPSNQTAHLTPWVGLGTVGISGRF